MEEKNTRPGVMLYPITFCCESTADLLLLFPCPVFSVVFIIQGKRHGQAQFSGLVLLRQPAIQFLNVVPSCYTAQLTRQITRTGTIKNTMAIISFRFILFTP